MTELLDIYDETLTQHLGTKPRPDVHRDGDWHRVFHCWVIYRDEAGDDWVIMQKRGADKATFPHYLDVSAAGHYAAGETARDGVRELHEELGLLFAFEDLIPVGQRRSIAQYDGLIDREVADVFLVVCNQPLRDYAYQQSELAGLIAVPVREALALFTEPTAKLNVPAVGLGTDTVTITPHDFIPTEDRYFERILRLARHCLDGEHNSQLTTVNE